jgi:hypothetical protein
VPCATKRGTGYCSLRSNLLDSLFDVPPTMPRPKVRPEERQRSCKACLACKSAKIRCDSQSPCASCIRRDRGNSCIYSDVDRRMRRHRRLVNTHYESSERPDTSPATVFPAVDNQYESSHPDDDPLNPTFSSGPITPEASNDGDHGLPLPGGSLSHGPMDEPEQSKFWIIESLMILYSCH